MNIHPSGKIFVFGSNLAGRHGAGAAKKAREYGAIYGISIGRQGNTFAIPTKDCKLKSLPLRKIKIYIEEFLNYAEKHSELQFFLTAIGTGLAGYTHEQIAPMFKGITQNVEIPLEWHRYIYNIRKCENGADCYLDTCIKNGKCAAVGGLL